MTGVVGVLIAKHARLFVVCQECGFIGGASLEKVAAAKGLNFDLTDCHPPCRAEGCGYWLGFYVQDGMAMRALETPEGARKRQQLRNRWMFEDGNAARRYALKARQQKAPGGMPRAI